jgi:hypothetical protein
MLSRRIRSLYSTCIFLMGSFTQYLRILQQRNSSSGTPGDFRIYQEANSDEVTVMIYASLVICIGRPLRARLKE